MCVPGAIAAMSAAMVMRKPADAARLPDGPTKTATGVFALMIALLMSRVESSRPPGVRSVMTISAAFSASARAIVAANELGCDRVDDAVDRGRFHDRPGQVEGEHRATCHQQAARDQPNAAHYLHLVRDTEPRRVSDPSRADLGCGVPGDRLVGRSTRSSTRLASADDGSRVSARCACRRALAGSFSSR